MKSCVRKFRWILGSLAIISSVAALIAGASRYSEYLPSILGCGIGVGTVVSARNRPLKRDQEIANDDVAASYSRFSSDMQRDEGITDQQRNCREAAEPNGHKLPTSLEFRDEAVSGTKLRREGLDRMIAAAEEGLFKVLYFWNLSRLARESVITMPLLKKLVYVHNIRVISVTEGIDSARDGWEVLATIIALQAENYIKELSRNVFRGHEGNVFNGFSIGDYCFGYTTVPIPGTEIGRRGRNIKPRMVYVIDDVEAAWVVRIFNWFVTEKRSLRWIARELNQRGAPKDHRSSKPLWHHSYVAKLMRNTKYIGVWPWGRMKTMRDPLTGLKRQEARPDNETEKWTRNLPQLRLVSDETFREANQMLNDNATKFAHHHDWRGRLNGSAAGSADQSPQHLLSMLLVCLHCGRRLITGGRDGKYMHCPGWRDGVCSCKTTLRRELAEELIIEQVDAKILDNPIWHEAILDSVKVAWDKIEAELPSTLIQTRAKIADLDQRITTIADLLERGEDSIALRRRLDERESERKELAVDLKRLEDADGHRGPPPDAAWITAKLQSLDSILGGACPAAALALRKLVGGAIQIEEIKREGKQRHFLRGTFAIKTANLGQAIAGETLPPDGNQAAADSVEETISIDFVEPNDADQIADQVMLRFTAGVKFREIARELGCGCTLVRRAFERWHEARGLKVPDGRSCRNRLPTTRKAQQLVELVMELWHTKATYGEIAKALNCDRNVVTEAVQIHFKRQGLPAPDGRHRRHELRNAG